MNVFYKSVLLISILLIKNIIVNAQVPQGIPYQAVARNGQGQSLANTNVKVRFSILDSTATGTAVYVESHSTTTSSLGLFTANVGMGAASTGTFSAINWGQNYKFLKVELDTTATGNSYIDLGTQQLMSVPYALYAGTTVNISNNNSRFQNQIIFHENDSFIVPPNVTEVYVEAWGGGQGGTGGYSGSVYCCNYFVGGGGSSGCMESNVITVSPNEVIGITVGVGGNGALFSTGGSYYLLPPASGGDSRFGNYLIAFGGGSPNGYCGYGSGASSYYQNSIQNGMNSVGGGRGGVLGHDGNVPGGGGGGGPASPGSNGGKGGDGLVIIHY
jgi:hypothetical protein